jgi:hypothetical protein
MNAPTIDAVLINSTVVALGSRRLEHPVKGASVAADPTLFNMTELERAAALVHDVVSPTPQYAWPKLKTRAGCRVWVKHENYTPTGAFKVRGGLVYLDRLRQADPNIPGVISATRGNHGQSLAFASARTGVPATIYVPHNNSIDYFSRSETWTPCTWALEWGPASLG